MICTEEEERTKWCSFIQISSGMSSGYNRDRDDDTYNCIASDCMSWAWFLGASGKGRCKRT